ncbi:SGNH/GDSL hydrolase family protein [Micromonospora sp. WMMD1082]|uniref:SGNH/GDSL hydrolase family protein n=1 Tax=Micromonospora sp. WMMD1082 TaxID=3016104 RepID=UPI002416B9FC|nr:SGNH/GDSL hydrolase family protein [Micromonospora sp. WMMD1082]MDG4793257.1 SGNH/GDSL hydrolase family protein [Micromonospora sp. WMMD1082]
MGVAGSVLPDRPRWRRALRVARLAAIGTGATVAAAAATTGVLLGQARQARRTIPMAEAPPPRCDGVYGAKFPGPAITMVVLGDSSAAGYGVHRRRETPGALLATGLSRRLQRPVRLHRFAVVGAISAGLRFQVEAALECDPDVAVILIGGNDVTNRTPPALAVRYLVEGVRTLRASGAEVVVGTCPDLGAIRPIQPPLRWLARRWSRQLAAAQTVAVVSAGGWTVSLGDLLGPRFTAEPGRMFAWDRFHPSADGYAVAAAALLPTVLSALGHGAERRPSPTRLEGVRSLPKAAHEAARHPGTEVSGTEVRGSENGPAGRWAQLRRRGFFGVGTAPQSAPTADSPAVEGLS